MASVAVIWLVLAVVVAAPFVVELARKPMGPAGRAGAPGAFARLSQGLTHYRWFGGRRGPVVVCVHGLTTPGIVWEGLAPALVCMGFRVLVYDLYGRGYSDAVPGAQDQMYFNTQLSDLLADQQVRGPVTLVGHSMGAAIATGFAARHPTQIRNLVLLAPAGMTAVATGAFRGALRVPLVGAWLMQARYPALLRRGLKAEAHRPTSVPGLSGRQAAELKRRGFIPAVHRSLCGLLSEDLRNDHEALRDIKTPVLAVWGAQDDVIALSDADRLTAWNPQVKTAVIPGAGHGLPYTHTDEVRDHIATFAAEPDLQPPPA